MEECCWIPCLLLVALFMCRETEGLSAPKWKPKSAPAIGDSVIAKLDVGHVKMNCAAKGQPKPSIVWYKDGQLFNHKQRPGTKARSYKLILNKLVVADKGDYMCVVRNSQGQLNFTFILDIITSITTAYKNEENTRETEVFNPSDNNKNFPNIDMKLNSSRIPFGELDISSGISENSETGKKESSVSIWTIYIIIGSLAGGVLLVGLVAITVTVCCNRIEKNKDCKHISVNQSVSGAPCYYHGNCEDVDQQVQYTKTYNHGNESRGSDHITMSP